MFAGIPAKLQTRILLQCHQTISFLVKGQQWQTNAQQGYGFSRVSLYVCMYV